MRGYRNVEAVDVDAVALVLVRVSQLLIDYPAVLEVDVNPLLAAQRSVVALDARIRIARPGAAVRPPPAIRPYPKELERDVVLADGRKFLLRPILPEDEPALQRGFARLTPEEIRARFFAPMKSVPHVTAARFTQIDYDREMALVLSDLGIPGRVELHAVVRLAADPDNEIAEFAIVVEKTLTGLGLGTLLLRSLIDYARDRGLRELYGDVLADNHAMLTLCRTLGFTETHAAGDFVVRVTLTLDRYIAT
jgi:acetyltransferase